MKDIFVDTNVAHHMVTPLSEHFKTFVEWLYKDGTLVLSTKLHMEYVSGNQLLAVVIDKLTKDGRVSKIPTQQLSSYRFKRSIERGFLSNYKDRVHIKTVCLSNRKMAIALDNNLRKDINSLPVIDKIQPVCVDCPSKLAYK